MSIPDYSDAEKNIDITVKGKLLDVPDASLEEVYAAFHELLQFDDDTVIKVTLAAVIANRIQGADPVWLFLVGPSSSAKTEFVMGLEKVVGTYLLSQVSVNTFLSGLPSKRETSLLLRLPSEAILLQKDFTTILTLRSETRSEILGQLREIFDGHYVREFGTGITKSWEGKLGFISGVTLEIENAIMTSSRFGDRFLYFRMPVVDDDAAMIMAAKNVTRGSSLRKVIKEKVAGYLKRFSPPEAPIIADEVLLHALRSLCAFAVQARTSVIKDYTGRNIVDVQLPEGPMRFFKEILTMATALATMSGGTIASGDYGILSKLAYDAIPSRRIKVLGALKDAYPTRLTTAEVAIAAKFPTETAHGILDELVCCGLVVRQKPGDGEGTADRWALTDTAAALMDYRTRPDPEKGLPIESYDF